MRLKHVIGGLSRNRGGLLLLSGLSAVLVGVERLLTTRQRNYKSSAAADVLPVKVHAVSATPAAAIREHYFTIRQTRSEFGYVYWVLQGFGVFRSFTLFDTWSEAMDEANRRIVQATALAEEAENSYQTV